MTTPTMCEANCGSTCVCEWEEVIAVVDDDEFLDRGLKHLTNAVYYKTRDNGGYAVVGRDVYEVRSDWFALSAILLDGELEVWERADTTYVKFVQSKETSLPSILKG